MRQRSISQISSASGVSGGSQGHDEADGIPDDVSVASSQQSKAVLSRKQRRLVCVCRVKTRKILSQKYTPKW